MPEIEGILQSTEILYGRRLLEDIKIVVGGIDFYKRIYKPTKKFKPKTISDFLSLSEKESFPKKEYFEKLRNKIGVKVKVKYEKLNTMWPYFLLDRINNIKIPKKYNEIEEINYLE